VSIARVGVCEEERKAIGDIRVGCLIAIRG